jgi:hypothetical protein
MARRRLTGHSLLVASTTLVLGCPTGAVSGNLVAPPMFELCVTAEPSTAAVQIDGVDLEADGCSSVYEGDHQLTASAEGYATYDESVSVTQDTDVDIVLTQDTGAR